MSEKVATQIDWSQVDWSKVDIPADIVLKKFGSAMKSIDGTGKLSLIDDSYRGKIRDIRIGEIIDGIVANVKGIAASIKPLLVIETEDTKDSNGNVVLGKDGKPIPVEVRREVMSFDLSVKVNCEDVEVNKNVRAVTWLTPSPDKRVNKAAVDKPSTTATDKSDDTPDKSDDTPDKSDDTPDKSDDKTDKSDSGSGNGNGNGNGNDGKITMADIRREAARLGWCSKKSSYETASNQVKKHLDIDVNKDSTQEELANVLRQLEEGI